MIYEIKRGSTVIAAVRASGKQFKAVMSEDRVEMEFSLPSPVTFQIGDTVEVYGQTYKINRPSNIGRRFDKVGLTYQLEFEALYYDLGKWELKTLDKDNQLTESEVYMMSDAATMIDLIVRNANRVSSGWTVGAVEATEVMQFGYSNAKLLTVLQDLADKYNLEFWVTGKQINFGRNEASSGLTWEYGKANELYELRRDRSDIPVINRLTVLGGTRNLPADYGHRRLQPSDGNPISVPPTGDVVEQTVTFDNIYPHRVGTVSHVPADNIFRDTSLDFNINNYLTSEPAKVAFTSGQLAGFTFTIAEAGYDHTNRRITLNPITDDPAYPSGVPNAVLKPAVGDKYVLLDIYMPPSYVAAEEAKLQDIGEQYLDDYKVSHYNWSASLKPKYVIEDSVELVLGNTVRIVDTPLGIDTDIRISGFTRDLQEAFRYEVSLSNIITVSELVSQRNAQDRLAYTIQRSGLADGSLQTSETLQSVTRRGSVTDRAITVRGTRNTHLLSLPLTAPLTEDVVPGEAYIWLGNPGSGSGGGSAGTLAGLDDTLITSPQNDQVLTYDASIGRWKNSTFTVDLTGYATQSWVNAQGYAVLGTAGGQVRNNTQLDARYKAIGWMPTWEDISDKPTTFAPSAHTHNAGDINAGTLAITRIPTGTTGSTVAIGNDSRIINGQTAFGWGNHASAGYAVRAADNTFTAHNHFTGALSIPTAAPSGPHAGQAYIWFGAPGSGSGGGSTGTLSGLDDVALASLANNQFLRYNSSTGKWVNSTFTVDLSGYAVLGTGSTQVRNNSQLDARYAPISHTHTIAQVTGLQGALDGKEPAFSKNSAFNRPFGTTANTAAQGNDARILNGQTAYGWGDFREFGLGRSNAITDLNTQPYNSIAYTTSSTVNNPFGYGSVINLGGTTGSFIQIYGDYVNDVELYVRRSRSNTLYDWRRIWHDGNLNPSTFGTLAGENTWSGHNHFSGALSIPQSAPTGAHAGQAYIWFGSPGSGSGGGSAGTLAGLDDIALASLANNQFLRYNSSTGKWVNSTFTVDLSGYAVLGTGSTQVRNNTQLDARYAALSHTHTIAQVTGLQGALDGKEPAFSKNSAFNRNFGTSANTVAQGNDSRIVNGQTAFGWGDWRDNVSLQSAGWGYQPNSWSLHQNNDWTGFVKGVGGSPSGNEEFGFIVSDLDSDRYVMLSTNGDGDLSFRNNVNSWRNLWHNGNLNPSTFGALAGTNTWTGHNHFTSALSIPQSAPTGAHAGQAYIWFGSPGSGSGGGTSGTLAGLDDIALSSLANNQLLRYNSSTGKWVNFTASYAPASHTHPISQITGLQAALDGKEPAFSKNTGFNRPFGTTANTVAQGNDSRIINGQTAFGWGDWRDNESLQSAGWGYQSNAWGLQQSNDWTGFVKGVSGSPSGNAELGFIVSDLDGDRYVMLSTNGDGDLSWRNNVNSWRNLWHSGNLANGTTSQYIRGDGSLATFPTIGTGTLSLSTGTGLQGSASFGANQTGNTTFSVSAASGYAIPTNTQIGNWNEVYGWGDFREFGLGRSNAITDLNTQPYNSIAYTTSSTVNNPFGYGSVINLGGATGSFIQIYGDYVNDVELYVRRSRSNTLYDWRRIWHDGNIDPVPTSRQINTGSHLTGGGNLSANRSLSVAWNLNTWVLDADGNQRLYFGRDNTHALIFRASSTTGLYRFRNMANSDVLTIHSETGDLSANGKITCPVIEPAAFIVPATAPSSPESGKRYLWVS